MTMGFDWARARFEKQSAIKKHNKAANACRRFMAFIYHSAPLLARRFGPSSAAIDVSDDVCRIKVCFCRGLRLFPFPFPVLDLALLEARKILAALPVGRKVERLHA